MAEYTYVEIQEVQPGAAAILNDETPCPRGNVLHRPGSGILTVRGIVNNPCAKFARYRVSFDGNIAIPEGGTPAEIQMAVAIGGEVLPVSIAAATPTVANAYWNVHGFATIDVPTGCCYTVAIRNASAIPTGATAAPSLNVRNLNVEVARQA